MKKKCELEILRSKVLILYNENVDLKSVVKTKLNQIIANSVLESCSSGFSDSLRNVIEAFVKRNQDSLYLQPNQLLNFDENTSFCVANLEVPGSPIVFASPKVCELTGYPMKSILGRSFNFLDGPQTDVQEVLRVEEGGGERHSFTKMKNL